MKFIWFERIEDDQFSELYKFYQKEWWTEGRSYEDMVAMLKGSDEFICCCTESGELAGMARILTDYTFKAFIFDVIVKQEFRNYGLGTEIVKRIFELEALNRVQSFELYCPDRLNGFYEKLGFKKSDSNLLIKKM